MQITEFLKDHSVILDGGMGTLLQARGLAAGELPERWNLSHPEEITAIHRAYFEAGANVVNTNTFGANSLKFTSDELEEIIKAAIENAQNARTQSGKRDAWVALDIGPLGRLLSPLGDLDFEDAVAIFAQTVRLGVQYGADLIVIETMSDCYETKAALLAAKENSTLPVFVSNAYGEDGKLMTGADPAAMVAMLEGLGADAIGVNCSLGPKALLPIVKSYLQCASVPILVKPNAGLPRVENGKTVYDVTPEAFASDVAEMMEAGVRLAGGCCGTTPDYIQALSKYAERITVKPITKKNRTVVSSYTHAVVFGEIPLLIGERINPTGKKRFQKALREGDIGYILNEGQAQAEKGVQILDVNVGLPEIDEAEMLLRALTELQAVLDLPLQIDTSDTVAMERALRRYNGKAMINSVNGKRESLEAVLPLAKKYGGVVVALTLDENGIPETAEGRIAIAEKILEAAERYGISKSDIVFDPLALTVSTDPNAAKETLSAVERITTELGCHTSLGVSNVSFGLPQRDAVNAAFFTMALDRGLGAAIMNPYSLEMRKAYRTYLALSGKDPNCEGYIAFSGELAEIVSAPAASQNATPCAKNAEKGLRGAVSKGLREKAAILTRELILGGADPLAIVQEEIIPALDEVGREFEAQRVYLPQLLMSAEAAKCAFEVIKEAIPADSTAKKCPFVLATVKGDIHDIGKNIVRLLLENYGYEVYDLGKDVSPEKIAEETVRLHAPLVGLSALMTTTVPAMEETIKLLRVRAPWCRIVVGGAVLTEEYAVSIGADHYAKDAMETVRYAESITQ